VKTLLVLSQRAATIDRFTDVACRQCHPLSIERSSGYLGSHPKRMLVSRPVQGGERVPQQLGR
jgi:hypothetical protein